MTIENTDATEPSAEEWQAITDATDAAARKDEGASVVNDEHGDNPQGGTPENDDDSGLSRRDVKYRERLRETEAERDTLRATVESMQRREVERLTAEHLVKPGSLWTVGVKLEDLLDDDGAVDAEKVRAAAVTARQQHGLQDPQAARKRQPVVSREGRSINTHGGSNSWAGAFK